MKKPIDDGDPLSGRRGDVELANGFRESTGFLLRGRCHRPPWKKRVLLSLESYSVLIRASPHFPPSVRLLSTHLHGSLVFVEPLRGAVCRSGRVHQAAAEAPVDTGPLCLFLLVSVTRLPALRAHSRHSCPPPAASGSCSTSVAGLLRCHLRL